MRKIEIGVENMQVVIDANTIITAGAVISALAAVSGILFSVHKWYLKQEHQDKQIAKQEQELCLLTYGVLACLKGLKEQGCNGPVTEAIDKIEKHVNKAAHELEE